MVMLSKDFKLSQECHHGMMSKSMMRGPGEMTSVLFHGCSMVFEIDSAWIPIPKKGRKEENNSWRGPVRFQSTNKMA
jgi:hypothetical protein